MAGENEKRLGVSVIATGAIGNTYLKAWSDTPGVEIVSVADVDEARAAKAGEEFGAKVFADYREAIACEGVDTVTVCTPTMLHPEVTIHAAEQGKHVLCVKPIALRLEDADRMIETCEKNNVKFCVGFMRRFHPVTGIVRRRMAEGQLGRPALYSVAFAAQVRPKILMHDANANGGPLIDMSCHFLDAARAYFDSDPVRVMAQGFTIASSRKEVASIRTLAVDTASAIVTFASGDVLSLDMCWGLPAGHRPPQGESFWAPNGWIGGLGFGTKELKIQTESITETIGIDVDSTSQDCFRLLVGDFARSIREDAPVTATGEDGRKALAVSLAMLESIETGKAVDLA